MTSSKIGNNSLKNVFSYPYNREWLKQWKYLSFMEIDFFLFSRWSPYNFLNFMKRSQTWQTQHWERFDRNFRGQKFVKLLGKLAWMFGTSLFLWGNNKLLTFFLKYKRNNKNWNKIKFGKARVIIINWGL